MKEKIKNLFKKYPKIYALLSNFYYKVKYLKLRFWGTKFEENEWAKRDIKTVLKSWENLNHPHRSFLIEEIKKIPQLSSILEIGCGYGPNLYHLAKIFPLAEIKGIDVNPLSVKLGNKWLKGGVLNYSLVGPINLINSRIKVLTLSSLMPFSSVLVQIKSRK